MSSKSPGFKRKQMMVKILMLDDTEVPFQIEPKMIGNDLINSVYEYLKLVESDYFGLEYYDSKGKKCWLDYDKFVIKQVQYESKLIFGVKFYTPDPGQLEEEYTRYLYALQIKRDLGEGLLLCSDATASLLVSYILQAEIGDFSDTFNDDPNYILNKRYFPHQNEEHISKIIEYHKSHIGQTPADADLNLLDIARKVELYGIVMHPAKDHENVQLNLAVANLGILVFQNYTKINTFSWAKIRKLSFRRKKFLVKLHSENYGFYKDTVEFYFDNRDDSKSFWKKCIEHHSFFRCISIMRIPRQKSKIFATRGSSFRYYGRTQKELIENARENFSKNRSFDRSYHSIRSIVTNHREPGQINGTQSLNRNLASRSAGALMIPSTGGCGSSTLSSNDSDHHYNLGMGQNTSSSAHHLSFNTHQSLKTPVIYADTNKSSISLKSLTDQRSNTNNNLPFLSDKLQNNEDSRKQRQQYEEDAVTHGSRTIDSRHSNDKTLGLSDDDDDDDDESDENEEDGIDGDFEDEEKTHPNNGKLKLTKSVNDFDSCTCGKEDHNNHINKERKQENEENKNDSEINKSLPNFLNELGNNKFDETNNKKDTNNLIIPQNASQVISNNLKLQTGVPDQQYYHVHQKDLVKLPITQEKKPKDKVKLEIINSSSSSTDNETISHLKKNTLPNNPNKIYSRKEVVTTSFKEEIKKSHLEEYRQTTTFYDPATSSSFKPQASNLSANVQKFSTGEYFQTNASQENDRELKQNKFQNQERSKDPFNYDKSHNERCLSDENDDEGKRLKNLDINKSSNSCSVSNDNLNEKDYDCIFDKSLFEKITGDLEEPKHSSKLEMDKKSKSKSKQKSDHRKEHKTKKYKKSNHLPSEKKSTRQQFANESLTEDRFNSLKKLTKTPVFITSTRLIDDLNSKVSKKNYQLNHKNKILVQDQELKQKRTKALKNNCDIMFISNSEISNGESCSKPRATRNKDLNFSLSSAISSSSLSYIKDMPLPSLSSSSSSDFSLISKPLSSSSSIDLSSINSSSVDSLRVSMIELSQLSANLNKKIIKSLKKDVGIHANKHVLVVPITKPKKKNFQEKVEIPVNKILHKTEDESLNTENHISKPYEETDCLNLTSNKKDCEYNKLNTCAGIVVSAPRKKSKNKAKRHKEKKSSSSRKPNSQYLSKSLPRCKKSTNDNEFNHNFSTVKKSNFESNIISNSCQAVNKSDYRKIINSFDLCLTNSVIVNGSTPNKHMTISKKKNYLDNELIKNKEISSSLSEALSEVGKDNLSILKNSERTENINKQNVDLNESISKNSNGTNSDDSSKTIRQILNKIVEAKISTINSDNLIKTETSPLIDNLDENDNISSKNSDELKEKTEIFPPVLPNSLEFIDSQVCYNKTEENIENNETTANFDEINSSDINNENFVESIPFIESEMSISVCLDQVNSDQNFKVSKNNLDFYPEEEANVIRNTVYKVLEMATEIVAEEYNLTRNKKSVTDNTTNNDEQRTQDSSYL